MPANTQDAGRALAASGDTLAVGAPLDDQAGADAGAVFIYARNGNNWTQQAKLTAPDAVANDRFGYALALDGDTLAVSARPVNSGGIGLAAPRWAVYIFRRVNSVWTQQARIAPANPLEQYTFGWSLALDGNNLAVGGPFTSGVGGDIGAAFVYVNNNNSWERQARLPDGINRQLGYAVAIRGNTLVVGAPNLQQSAQPAGLVNIYTRNGIAWSLSQTFFPRLSTYPFDGNFGSSVTTIGDTIAVSSFSAGSSSPISAQAVVYIYRLVGGVWNFSQRLDAVGSISLSVLVTNELPPLAMDAGYIFMGHEYAGGPGESYLFRPNGNNSAWQQYARVLPSDQSANTTFGAAVAIANGRAFVGDPDTGAVYVYDTLENLAEPAVATLTTAPNPSLVGQPVTFTAIFRDSSGNPLTGKAHFYVRNNEGIFLPYVGPVELVNGVATGVYAGFNSLTTGSNRIVAQYSGNQAYRAKFTNEATQLVVSQSLATFQPTVITLAEGPANAAFTLQIAPAPISTVSVNYATVDRSALAGSDYQATSGTLTFNAGETSKTFSVPIINDTAPERTEFFDVQLSGFNGVTCSQCSASVSILDDDTPQLGVLSVYSNNENGEQVDLDVERLGDLSRTVAVNYATADDTSFVDCALLTGLASSRCDYVPTRGRLTFAAGEAIKRATIPVINDFYTDGNETVRLILSNPTGGATLGANNSATPQIFSEDVEQPTATRWVTRANGDEAVPQVPIVAIGVGSVQFSLSQYTISSFCNFCNTNGGTTYNTQLRGPAHTGGNGPLILDLGAGPVNNRALPLNATQEQQLKNGLFYLEYTANNATRARGQLLQNPLDGSRFFVRQQYYDFLSRIPDAAGANYWAGQIADCGADLACIHRRRIDVSAAFFVEQEFQESGAFIFRLYKSAFGEQTNYRPTFAQFVPDRALIPGGPNLNADKLALANDFVSRSAFTTRYPATQTAAQFVDAILLTVQQGAGVTFAAAERAAFINDVNAIGRGLMLKNLGDNAAFKQAVFNRAFVLMEYFGYLRRDPDQAGYDFWLNILNTPPNNPRGMVCAFVTSAEYQLRFSPFATRNDAACNSL